MPDDQKRCCIYARQSITINPEDSLSLDFQVRACREYIAAHGMVQVADPFVDPDQRGWWTNRPAFTAMLERVKQGGVDVIVVYKLARLSRSLVHQESVMADVDTAGAGLVSVTEPWVSTSPMVRQILGAVNEQHRRDLADYLRSSFEERAKRGLTHGNAPFGYRKEAGLMRIDEDDADLVRQMYAWAEAGESLPRITDRLNASGMRPRRATGWSPTVVRKILRNQQYAGSAMFRDQVAMIDAHEPVIPMDQWRRVQAVLDHRAIVRRKRIPSWLDGFLFCDCGGRMHLKQHHYRTRDGRYHPTTPYFRCAHRYRDVRHGTPPSCTSTTGAISARVIEPKALRVLGDVFASLSAPTAVEAYLEATFRQDTFRRDALTHPSGAIADEADGPAPPVARHGDTGHRRSRSLRDAGSADQGTYP